MVSTQIKINDVTYSYITNYYLRRRKNVAVHSYLSSAEEIFEDIFSMSILEATYRLKVNEVELSNLRMAKDQKIVTLEDFNISQGAFPAWFYDLQEIYVAEKDRPWLVTIKLLCLLSYEVTVEAKKLDAVITQNIPLESKKFYGRTQGISLESKIFYGMVQVS